jgi:hypothetical protein
VKGIRPGATAPGAGAEHGAAAPDLRLPEPHLAAERECAIGGGQPDPRVAGCSGGRGEEPCDDGVHPGHLLYAHVDRRLDPGETARRPAVEHREVAVQRLDSRPEVPHLLGGRLGHERRRVRPDVLRIAQVECEERGDALEIGGLHDQDVVVVRPAAVDQPRSVAARAGEVARAEVVHRERAEELGRRRRPERSPEEERALVRLLEAWRGEAVHRRERGEQPRENGELACLALGRGRAAPEELQRALQQADRLGGRVELLGGVGVGLVPGDGHVHEARAVVMAGDPAADGPRIALVQALQRVRHRHVMVPPAGGAQREVGGLAERGHGAVSLRLALRQRLLERGYVEPCRRLLAPAQRRRRRLQERGDDRQGVRQDVEDVAEVGARLTLRGVRPEEERHALARLGRLAVEQQVGEQGARPARVERGKELAVGPYFQLAEEPDAQEHEGPPGRSRRGIGRPRRKVIAAGPRRKSERRGAAEAREPASVSWRHRSCGVGTAAGSSKRCAMAPTPEPPRTRRLHGDRPMNAPPSPDPAGLTADVALALETLVLVVERQSREFRASVLLLSSDGRHMVDAAAPSLPDEYRRAIDGLAIGPVAGSCGTAAYRNARVIVTDIARDPLWDAYRELALPHGLAACWSEPIRSPTGEVLGTFALYYPEPRSPTRADLELIGAAADRAAALLERARAGADREQLVEGLG